MQTYSEPARVIPVSRDVDVIVVGGGPAQCRLRRLRPARDVLVMVMTAHPQVGECRMREKQLPGREAAGVVGRQPGTAAEEGDLEAVAGRFARAACRAGPDPAGGVPPFGARAEVRAVVARKFEHAAAAHGVRFGICSC